jgi:hypothetical protein
VTDAPTTTRSTAEPSAAATNSVAEKQMRMLELFAAICGAPDDAELATLADGELAELDRMLQATP